MADPSKYTQGYDFSEFSDSNPSTPLPGNRLDNELANIDQSTEELRDAIKDVRRSDGKLKNGIVTRDSLADSLASLIGAWRGQWATATAYAVDDTVEHDGSSYICRVAHMSGVFATDLVAVKWALVAARGEPSAIQPGNGISVDTTDPNNPVVAVTIPPFATLAIAAANDPANAPVATRTVGYANAGDGGGALYRLVVSEPSHAGKYQDAAGNWYEIAEPQPNVKMFGARGDGILLTDGVSTNTDATFTSASAAFTADDVGKLFFAYGAGSTGGKLITTIASVNSATSIELSDAAATSATNVRFFYGSSDGAAIQAAFDMANISLGNALAAGSYPIVRSGLTVPPGIYMLAPGTTLRVLRGLDVAGANHSATVLVHCGGSVDAIDTDPSISNAHVRLRDFTLVGAGAGTTAGIRVHENVRDGELSHVVIGDCQDNLYADQCYAMVLDRCDFQAAVGNNIRWINGTAAKIRDCRIDGAGDHNLYISGDGTTPTVNLVLDGSYLQRAQKAGIYAEDVDMLSISGGYFEGNNISDAEYADIHWVRGAAARGVQLSLFGCYGTATSGGDDGSFVYNNAGACTLVGCYNYVGTAPASYSYGLRLGSTATRATIIGGSLNGASAKVLRSATSQVVVQVNQSGGTILENVLVASASNIFKETLVPDGLDMIVEAGGGNFYKVFDSPSNRRLELRLRSGGTDKWFIGRGDGDESFPDDFYIARQSGGTGNPDFAIDETTGRIRLGQVPTYADQAAAGTGGVATGQLFKTSTGQVLIKT